MTFARLLVFLKVNFKSALDDWKCNLISNIGDILQSSTKTQWKVFLLVWLMMMISISGRWLWSALKTHYC